MRGSSTERALVDLAIACGIDVEAVRVSFPRLGVVHRTERRALMITLHAMREGGRLLAVKGAPNEVLRLCRMQLAPDGQERPMADIDRRWFETENIRMASAALRVLGCAYAKDADADRNGSLIWLGLVGMSDPPRHGTRELVRLFQRAGIDTVMLTGDQPATARAIAEQLGLARDGDIELIDATQLEEVVARMPDVAKRADVFARISPSHKLRIVRALQKGGSIVAMTGDGVNDSPALKAADIGVAMGRSGTDVAREVADIVLEDDDLHGMLVAVQEGRTIYVNIRKSLHYLLSTNLSEINMALAATALGMGQPLTPVQLLWIRRLCKKR
jgi:P-type Ca2+ transporter type 2C